MSPWPRATRAGALVGLVLLASGCSSTADGGQAEQTSRAQSLVAAADAAGLAPGLTVDAAESLYGTDAPQICGVLDDGVQSAQSLISSVPVGRRTKLFTTNAVAYERLVVGTYCPEQLPTFDALVAAVPTVEVSG